MKKLLFLTSLLAIGTMAMADPVDPSTIDPKESKAEVLVKAKIVDDFFKITDINGNPLELDFKELPAADYSKDIAKASVEYKITATQELSGDASLTMSFTSFTSPESKEGIATVFITNKDTTTADGNVAKADKIEVKLGLDEPTKTIKAGQYTAVGTINGVIDSDLSSNNTGEYTGKVYLMATLP